MVEYFTSNLWLFWVIICVICLILEVSSGTFYIMCFAIGSIFSVAASLIDVPFWGQVVVFAVFSALSIFCVRPLAIKYLHRGEDKRASNVDALIGRVGTVIDAIEAGGSGYVKIDGDEWKAVTQDGLAIAKGNKVKVVSMDSIVVTVIPCD
jgi:membrane protein implicated in regulation of membrane protease activity